MDFRWLSEDIKGLFDKPRAGCPRKWQPEDLEYLQQALQAEQRTYNSAQLVEKLKQERQVELSAKRLKQLLKKRVNLEKNSSVTS